MVPQKLIKSLKILRIMSIFNYIIGAFLLIITISAVVGDDRELQATIALGVMTLITLGLGFLLSNTINGLKEKKNWAWVTAVIYSSIMVPSVFIILAIPSLLGLFHKDTREFIA